MTGLWIDNAILALDLSPGQKLLLAAICFRAAISEDNICRDTNDRLGQMLGTHPMTASREVKALHEKGFVVADDGKRRGNRRSIAPRTDLLELYTDAPTLSETLIPSKQNADSPLSETLIPSKRNAEPHNNEEKTIKNFSKNSQKVIPLPVSEQGRQVLLTGTTSVPVSPSLVSLPAVSEPPVQAKKKKAPPKPAAKPEPPALPFGEAFALVWAEWTQYRKEKKKPDYKPTGLKSTLSYLSGLADANEQKAIAIIRQSMQRNWDGLFKINETTAAPTHQPSTVQKPEVIRNNYGKQSFKRTGTGS